MDIWAILKILATTLAVSLVLKTAVAALFYKVRDLRGILTVIAVQYVTATLSAIIVLYFTPAYVAATPDKWWMMYVAVALMLVFSIMVESFLFTMREVSDKPTLLAIAGNILSFAACSGLTLIGTLPAVF